MRRIGPTFSRRAFIALIALVSLVGSILGSSSISFSAQAPANRNAIIFVADGLRPTSVTQTNAPTLFSIRNTGVNFANSHSLFPTFTTPNASAIATGHYLGDTGDFSNTIYAGFPVPNASGSVTPFIENDAVLADIDERFGFNFLNEEALLALARNAGLSTAAVGKLGPILIQDVTQGNRLNGAISPPATIIIDDRTGQAGGVPLNSDITTALTTAGLATTTPGRGLNGASGSNTTPGTLFANTTQQQYFVDTTTKGILPLFKSRGKPFVLVYWSRDPDGTQHNQGDSLNSLDPGINGPTSRAAVRNADNNLAELINALRSLGLYANTDIFITADHGFSTISRSVINKTAGRLTQSYAATLPASTGIPYTGVAQGFLPAGFVAIDVAHFLGQPLYDPDTPAVALSNGNVTYTAVNATQGQRPKFGNGVIGGTGAVTNGKTDGLVVVAANGGSDLIYFPNGNPTLTVNGKSNTLAKHIADFLTRQDYVSGLFADSDFGSIPGTLPLGSVNLKGSAITPVPAIFVNFRTFSTGCSTPTACGVEIADTSLQQGQGMHGTFGRADTFNNMAAIGPDFKRRYVDSSPVSNADVALTMARILRISIPSKGSLRGRVLTEALAGGPNTVPYVSRTLKSAPADNGQRTVLNYQVVGRTNTTRYFDAAGFPGRTVGLNADTGG